MALRVKIYPSDSFLVNSNLFKIKGIILVDEKPNILHFQGRKKRTLIKLVKSDKPQFIVNHSFPSFSLINFPQAYFPLKDSQDLLKNSVILTNNETLSRFYFRRLGLNAEIRKIEQRKSKQKSEVNFWLFLNKINDAWRAFKSYMFWE